MSLNSKFQKPRVYTKPSQQGRVTKWLCGGLQIRIRGFKSLSALLILLAFFLLIIFTLKSSANLIINEVMYDPEPSDNYNEWVELYNPTNKSINVTGWSIIDNSGEDFIEGNFDKSNGTTIIPQYSYAIITDQGTKAYENFKVANNTICLYIDDKSIGNGLGNSGDKLILKDSLNNTIDSVEWIINFTDITGEPAKQVSENLTLSRYNNIKDSSRSFYKGYPTPGSKNHIIENGITEINVEETEYLIKRNEKLEITLNIKNLGDFTDNISIEINNITQNWNASFDKKYLLLYPGETENVTLYIIQCQKNSCRYGNITIVAKSDKENSESDKIELSFEVLGVDLWVKELKIYNEGKNENTVFKQGEIVRIKGYLKNLGKQNATDAKINFYYDYFNEEHFIGSKIYDSIGKYQKYPSVLWDTVNVLSGEHTIYAVADKKENIEEFDESNNVLSIRIQIIDTSPSTYEKNILITEFYFHNRPGVKNEYIKIYNPSSIDIDISGWYFTTNPLKNKFEQNKITFPKKTKIKSKNFLLVTQNASAYLWETNEKADFEYVHDSNKNISQMDRFKSFVLSNNGDFIVLKNEYNHTIDSIVYGEKHYNYTEWIGESITTFGEGVIYKRNNDDSDYYIDTNTKNDWERLRCYYIGQSDFSFEKIIINGMVKTFVSPDCSFRCITNEIKNASNSIYLNIYEFTSNHLCDEIIKVLIRNVSVNILIDGSPVGGLTVEEKYLLKRIKNYGGGIRFIKSNEEEKVHRRYSFNHAKYLIVDNKTVIVESCNFADTGVPVDPSFGNREWGIVIKNKTVAKYFLEVFFEDFEKGRCDIFSYDSLNITIPYSFLMNKKASRGWYKPSFSSKVFVGNISVYPVFSPDNSYKAICDLIEKANYSIYIQQLYIYPNWTLKINPFVECLIDKSKNGIDVKVIINYNYFYESANEKNNYTKKLFEENGIEVKYIYNNWSYFTNVHNKGMIVDNSSVLISSINWNENSITRNREAGVIIENKDVAEYYKKVFFYDWDLSPVYFENKTIEKINSTMGSNENTIYIILIFTVTFVFVAQDWRKRKWK